MKCRECDYIDSKVIESRDQGDATSIRRRRQCLGCGHRFTTYERIEMPAVAVIKKDGRREQFDRDKITGGILKACEKRPIPIAAVNDAVEQIEREVRSWGEQEVASDRIGELIMNRLIDLDDVAYVRFASVYRSFADVASFERELIRLKSRGDS